MFGNYQNIQVLSEKRETLGNDPAACADFQTAINMGDKDAGNNYEKFCKKKN